MAKQKAEKFRLTLIMTVALMMSIVSITFLSVVPTGASDTLESDTIESEYKFESDLIIKAINPGYKIDGVSDVGEFIEIANLSGISLSLADYQLVYTNSSGNQVVLLDFPETSSVVGDSFLLRYKRSPNSSSSDLVYTTSLAMGAGPLELVYGGEVVDSVCWTGKGECVAKFTSTTKTTLVRDLTTGQFQHLAEYAPVYDSAHPALILPSEEPDEPLSDNKASEQQTLSPPHCKNLEFSEIYTYYVANNSEQFIELYNAGEQEINLEGCQLRYKKKLYPLSGKLQAGAYWAYYPGSTVSFTKNPTSSNTVELLDTNGQVVDELTYLHGQKKSASFAKFYDSSGSPSWSRTFARTPGKENIFQEFQTCEAGKVINPETGNCVKVTSTALAECPAGKYRNPLTGRCKNIESTTAKKPCQEGYERNPDTGRCRKVRSENTGEDYALVPTTRSDQKTFIGIGVVVLLIAAATIYVVLQFRREIARAFRKARQRFHDILENLLTRKIRRHRNKEP